MPEDDFVPIGELARRTGVAQSALRYYERVGLLSPAGRTGGRRFYAAPSAERVALIRLCQDAGFTLAEIGRLIPALRRGGRPLGHIAERKISELDARIADAQRAKTLIEHALECPHRDRLTCPRFRSALEAQLQDRGALPRERSGLSRGAVDDGTAGFAHSQALRGGRASFARASSEP